MCGNGNISVSYRYFVLATTVAPSMSSNPKWIICGVAGTLQAPIIQSYYIHHIDYTSCIFYGKCWRIVEEKFGFAAHKLSYIFSNICLVVYIMLNITYMTYVNIFICLEV